MNSTSMMTWNDQHHVQRNIADKVRVRVTPRIASSSASPPWTRAPACLYARLMMENYSTFKASGEPARFLRYEDGSWVDFPGEAMAPVRSGFLEGKTVVEVEVDGSTCLIDFARMLQIDLGSGGQRSVAWIDVNGNCFFPKTFVSSSVGDGLKMTENRGSGSVSEHPNIQIEIRIADNLDPIPTPNPNKRKRDMLGCEIDEGSSSSEKRQVVVAESGPATWQKVRRLKEAEKPYVMVRNLFLGWLGAVEQACSGAITAIWQCTRPGPLDKARSEVFKKQMEITKAVRGDPNVTFAWHATSADGVTSILNHGFGLNNSSQNGIYLSPARSGHKSAIMSEEDDKGEKHVILCRVILGKCEKVEVGSRQLYPSGEEYDTGVDDINNPEWYVVWGANMNTHILPECVVSYKLASSVTGTGRLNGINGSSALKWMPNATNKLTAELFSKLSDSLPSPKVQDFHILCSKYKDGKVAKNDFMQGLRSIVGDEKLRSAMWEIRG
ncbi:hypothetical protein RJ639_007165 [Escallonia herrerae]|uniref:Poly [ADP-ribose] polymerase n=1 Tax=Escallonia herrerae TaxID=1293975 RepID=A0AA88VY50_9ASTE|nr:hypothetical protein RJ639_007165 [Escallonia herrerae]